MSRDPKDARRSAVQRFQRGEDPRSICASLGQSRPWLYKWVNRFNPNDPSWCETQSTRPSHNPRRTPSEIEEIVKWVRLKLYNDDLFCGAQAILWEMEDMGIVPLPSERTINRILVRNSLTHRRTGKYEPKGTPYPELPSDRPNQTQQGDLVGPSYLKGPVRFYSQNAVDLATSRGGTEPLLGKDSQSIINGFWAIWCRLGFPENLQLDNDASYCGSPAHPRGMGALIRLCLHQGIEPWFIPMAEPWRNGEIEAFNNQYKQKFLKKTNMTDFKDLATASLAFEYRLNSRYRFSKLGGKTPLMALTNMKATLSFPKDEKPPMHPLPKPETGRYHLVRLIRSNLKLNVFGELFPVSPDLQYQYVVATIDVKEQRLKLFLDRVQVDEFDYMLR